MTQNDLQQNAPKAAAFLKGLANPHRLMILCQLAQGEKSVSELVALTTLQQTSVSQHLGKLREEGILTYRQEHRTHYYSIAHPSVLKIMSILYEDFCTLNSKETHHA